MGSFANLPNFGTIEEMCVVCTYRYQPMDEYMNKYYNNMLFQLLSC